MEAGVGSVDQFHVDGGASLSDEVELVDQFQVDGGASPPKFVPSGIAHRIAQPFGFGSGRLANGFGLCFGPPTNAGDRTLVSGVLAGAADHFHEEGGASTG